MTSHNRATARPSARRTATLALAVCATVALGTAPAATAAPIGQPAKPFPDECRSGATLTLGETVAIVADALKKRAPGNSRTIDSAAASLSRQINNATISTLVVTQRGSEVSPGQGVQATHGANALVQRVLSIKNGTYRDGTKVSSISVNDAIETVLLGLEITDQVGVNTAAEALGEVVSSAVGVPIVGTIAGDIVKYIVEIPGIAAEYGGKTGSEKADGSCLAPGDGTKPIKRQVVKNAFDVDVSPQLTAFAQSVTLSSVDCRPLADLSLDEAIQYFAEFRSNSLPTSQRASFTAQVNTIRGNLRKTYVSNAFVPKDATELTGVFETVATLPLIGGPGLVYAAGVLQNLAAGGEVSHLIPLSSVSVNAVFNGARAANELLPLKSAAEYGYASTQGTAKALCRTVDQGKPYPGADKTIYNPNPVATH